MLRALLLTSLFLGAEAHANIVWHADFETHDLSQWDSYVVHAERWTFIQSAPTPAQGVYAARIELQENDVGPSNLIRTEVGHTPASLAVFQDTERYYAWSSMGSTTNPLGAFDHQLMFWECDAPIYQQEMSLHVSGTQVSFAVSPQGGQYQTKWTGTFANGVWHQFVLHVKWSLDATVGFVELRYDGALVLPKLMMRTMHAVKDSNGNDMTPITSTMHHGLFLGTPRAGKPVEVVFLDDVREATTLADVFTATPDAGTPDAGHDAGAPDAGVADAGLPDAGGVDAGTPADAGAELDAGTLDAGMRPDAGFVDPGGSIPGCGCGASPSSFFPWVALALARLKRRKCPKSG